ncbi:MAG: leucyl/phenylalanyl-tRNA--protein transferase [Tatlockia sp.]|nr:leucyl/phenylalanyl-tRNA--protein transferase [Tatlockia sp.]
MEKFVKSSFLLSETNLDFPNPESSDKNGLVAIGGDLSPGRILSAYKQGIFPWFGPEDPLLWWSPNPRLVLNPNDFKVSKSLRQALKKPYIFTIDTAFAEVINACANSQGRANNTWITKEMCQSYTDLYLLGFAHSFEIWDDENLIGGLYGLSLGHAFFGESMFHRVRDASKIAMFHLCQVLTSWNFQLIDCQLPNAYLERLGAKKINRKQFLLNLRKALKQPTRHGRWTSLV